MEKLRPTYGQLWSTLWIRGNWVRVGSFPVLYRDFMPNKSWGFLEDGPIALIVVPTRELAIQVYHEAKRFGKVNGAWQCLRCLLSLLQWIWSILLKLTEKVFNSNWRCTMWTWFVPTAAGVNGSSRMRWQKELKLSLEPRSVQVSQILHD